MSRLRTTAPLKMWPPAAAAIPITTNPTPWDNGDWVPFGTTSADDTAIAGVKFQPSTDYSGLQLEVEFGIAAGDDTPTPIGHIRLHLQASGNGGPTEYRVKYPISGIEPGLTVSARLRSNDSAGPDTWDMTVLYYEDLDSDQHVPYTTAMLTSFPAGTDSIVITPSATPWDDSAWEVFDDETGADRSVFGMAMGNPSPGNVDAEIDLGEGTTELTMFRIGAWDLNSSRMNMVNLPGLMPITDAVTLTGRLRKSGTSTDPFSVAFLGYADALVPPEPGEGVIGPLLWITMPFRPPRVT